MSRWYFYSSSVNSKALLWFKWPSLIILTWQALLEQPKNVTFYIDQQRKLLFTFYIVRTLLWINHHSETLAKHPQIEEPHSVTSLYLDFTKDRKSLVYKWNNITLHLYPQRSEISQVHGNCLSRTKPSADGCRPTTFLVHQINNNR